MPRALRDILEDSDRHNDERLLKSQHREIKKHHGSDAAENANYAWGSGKTDEGHPFFETKTDHGVIKSTLNTKTKKVTHEHEW